MGPIEYSVLLSILCLTVAGFLVYLVDKAISYLNEMEDYYDNY